MNRAHAPESNGPTAAAARELAAKLETVRAALATHDLAAVRLRGADFFAWLTGGGASGVLLASETGVAEAFVTARGAWVLTTNVEAGRLRAEELPPGLDVSAHPWAAPAQAEVFVGLQAQGGRIASDRPAGDEVPLPPEIVAAKRRLLHWEVDRYRTLGVDAAVAVTQAFSGAEPAWTEQRLAGEAAAALWSRGIEPALVLVAGERRLPLYRHPRPGADPLGQRAMLVVCGRRGGLYANLTRFVAFRPSTDLEQRLMLDVAQVEAAALAASRTGETLGGVYQVLAAAYARLGHPGAETQHHQGGPTGYLSRESLAMPGASEPLAASMALAWNPSLPGTKMEDTVLLGPTGVEVLTVDPSWPTFEVDGRARPDVLTRP